MKLFGKTVTVLLAASALAGCERDLILTGQRFDPRQSLTETAPAQDGQLVAELLPQNKVVPIALGSPAALASWTHRGGNAAHSLPHGALSAAPQRVWSAAIGAGNSRKNRITAAPIVANGVVFAMDAASSVTALSASTGGVVWRAIVSPDLEDPASMSGGGLAYDGGTVFVTTGFGELLALDAASGAVRWRQNFDSPVSGAPTVAGGMVFVTGRDNTAWAVSVRDGRQRWLLPGLKSTSGVVGTGSAAVGDGVVVFPFASRQLVAVNQAKGDLVWASAVAGQRRGRAVAYIDDIAGDPVIAAGTVYAGTSSGRMAAISARTGERLWDAAEGTMGAPLVVGGSVFVVSDEGRLVRLDARSGETIWAAALGLFTRDNPRRQKAVTAHYGPVLAGGSIVVASSDGTVRRFAADSGAEIGRFDVQGGITAPPALAGGAMYVVSANGQVHAFR